MLAAIDLDDQRSLDANKIRNIGTERNLPAEATSIQLLPADALP